MKTIFLIFLPALLVFSSCATIKPWEKEYLLHPLMDDGVVAKMQPDMMNSATGNFEKLSGGSGGGAGATSCPTCGG